jgi:hypothetical protein
MNSVASIFLLSAVLLGAILEVTSQECPIQRNTQNCPGLVLDQAVVASCGVNGCYNYCNDKFASCCGENDFTCSIRCDGTSGGGVVITAGCLLSDKDKLPPSPPSPPAQRPTVFPPQCYFRENTQNCARLTRNQAVVPSCGVGGCYNYCNDVFTGCCDIDDDECLVRCSVSPTDDFPVVTAGCRLNDGGTPTRPTTPRPTTRRPTARPPTRPPTPRPTTRRPTARPPTRTIAPIWCTLNSKACVRSSECCSNRCVAGKCVLA